jgi:hypothetical protein
MSRARRRLQRGKIHIRRAHRQRLPLQAPFQQQRRPALPGKGAVQLLAQPVELVVRKPRAVARIIDQRARRPRRILQQARFQRPPHYAWPPPDRRRQASRAVMVVDRVIALDMDDVGRGVFISIGMAATARPRDR